MHTLTAGIGIFKQHHSVPSPALQLWSNSHGVILMLQTRTPAWEGDCNGALDLYAYWYAAQMRVTDLTEAAGRAWVCILSQTETCCSFPLCCVSFVFLLACWQTADPVAFKIFFTKQLSRAMETEPQETC